MEPKPLKAADKPAPAPGKAGGVYIPPFKLAAMMREAKVCSSGFLRSVSGPDYTITCSQLCCIPGCLSTSRFGRVVGSNVPLSALRPIERSAQSQVPNKQLHLLLNARRVLHVQDTESAEYQRLTWDALRKSINGLVNKVNVSNIKFILPEFFSEVRVAFFLQHFAVESACPKRLAMSQCPSGPFDAHAQHMC